MGTNFIKLGLLVTVTQVLLSSGCNKNNTKPCQSGGYVFSVTSAWSPEKQIYNIGDTLFLYSEFSKTLTDLINPSITIDYSNAVGIGGAAAIYELDTIAHQPIGSTSKFDFFSEIGVIGNDVTIPSQNKSLLYKELSTTYAIKIKIVPKQKGIFTFFIPDLKSNGLIGKRCTNASFANTLTNTNKGLALFQYAMNRPPASQYETDRIYCFRVQ
ncbi:MAG: hypothetical protein HZA79_16920 [Sphingobacteriales bacterium]|nr:hypothetical protein [Sphingobacteriales bacterium]